MIKLLFADDNMLALNQLDQYAALHEDEMQVVGRARNGETALQLIERQKPDIAFIDADMPMGNGVEVARAVAKRRLPVKLIGLSNFDSYEYVRGMMKAGAADYLLKHELDEAAFVEKVREVYAQSRPAEAPSPEPVSYSRADLQRLLMGFLAGEQGGEWIPAALLNPEADAEECALILIELSGFRPDASGGVARYTQSALSVVSNLCETVARGAVCRMDDMRLAALVFPPEGERWQSAEEAAENISSLISGNLMRLMRLNAQVKFAPAAEYRVLKGAYAGVLEAPSGQNGRAVWAGEERYSDHVRLCLREIHEKYAQSITLERTAKRLYLSPVYLSRRFRAEIGVTFIDYLTQLRVSKAKALLAQTGRSVKEISVLTGFRDDSYFIKVFKQRAGLTPAEYRALGTAKTAPEKREDART